VTPNARLPLVALAAFMAFAGIDLAWPITPASPIEDVDDSSCIDSDDDGPDSVVVTIDVEEDGAAAEPFRIPDPGTPARRLRLASSELPRAPGGDEPFRPPQPPPA
jgi:hypothetical protein